MNHLLLLIVVASVLLTTNAVPIGCQSQDINALDFGDSTILYDSLSSNCKNKDICVFSCGQFVRGCKANAFFTSFTNGASHQNKQKILEAYKKVCFRKVTENGGKTAWVNKKIVEIASSMKLFNEKNRLRLNSNDAINRIL